MKRRYFLAFVLTALAGSALHFGFALCPSPLVGLFCPVSESVWEHLKLLYWPFLAAGFVLNRKAENVQAAWSGTLTGLLFMPAFLLGVYYTGSIFRFMFCLWRWAFIFRQSSRGQGLFRGSAACW